MTRRFQLMKNNATSSDRYVFISYKSEEKELADRIKSFLEQHGVKWWMAPDSLNQVGTQDYSNDIYRAIRGCSCLIFAVSSSSLSSKWVNREVRYALDKCEKPIIPFVVIPVPERVQEENPLYITMMLEKQILNGDGTWDMEKVLMPYLHRVFGVGGVIEAPLKQTASSSDLTSSSMTERIAGMTTIVTLPGGAEMEMIYCPPGEFLMGSPESESGRRDDEVQHCVKLTKGFWLGKCPVTQAQWKSVMGSAPSHFKGNELPVETVSWHDCQDFIKKVNASKDCIVRLPTEAEWEYACRAGTATPYSWGCTLNGDRANCDGCHPYGTSQKGTYAKETTPPGRYGANPWGFFDMHGNVWEWCSDWLGRRRGTVDPIGPASGSSRIRRGGSWFNGASDCRAAFCDYADPADKSDNTGFRLCCSVLRE